MKRALTATAAIIAALLLAGCSAAATPAPTGTVTVAPSAEASAEPSESAGPVEVDAMPEPDPKSAAADFLVSLQLVLANRGLNVDADQVRSAADYTCDQIAAEVPRDQIRPISGEIEDWQVAEFVELAEKGYCPIR